MIASTTLDTMDRPISYGPRAKPRKLHLLSIDDGTLRLDITPSADFVLLDRDAVTSLIKACVDHLAATTP